METIRNYFIAFWIVFAPAFVLWQDVGQGQVYGLFAAAIICLAMNLSIEYKTVTPKTNIYLTLFLSYTVCWFVYWLWYYYLKMIIADVILLGIDVLLFFFCAVIFYDSIVKSSWKAERWFKFICISVLVQASIGITQYLWFDPIGWILSHFVQVSYGEYARSDVPVGILTNTNYFGAFLAVGFFLFFRKWWFLALPIITYALWISLCRTAMFAVIIVALICLGKAAYKVGKNYPKLIGSIYLLACSFAGWLGYILYSRHTSSVMDRYVTFWKPALTYWLDSWQHFIFGVGPGITVGYTNNLHSEYVSLAFNYGLIGIVIIGAFVVSTLLKYNKLQTCLLASFLVILINMLANHLLHIPTTGLLTVIVVALTQKQIMEERQWHQKISC